MHVLAGANSYQDALDDYQGDGLFTHFVLAGLKGRADANHDTEVMVRELGPYLENAVKDASQGRQAPLIRNFGEDPPMAKASQ